MLNAQETETVTFEPGSTAIVEAPSWNLYNRSYTQTIYTNENLGGKIGTITAIAYKQYTNNGNATNRTIDVYMANTNKNTFSSKTDFVAMTSSDLVYSGKIEFKQNGDWIYITLDKGFEYTGGNLLISVNDKTGSFVNSATQYLAGNVGSNRVLCYYKDATPDYDPSSPSGTSKMMTTINNMQFVIESGEQEPTVPAVPVLAAEATGKNSIELSWNSVFSATSYNIYQGSSQIATNITETTFAVENLEEGTEYCFSVSAVNEIGESAKSVEVCATTKSTPTGPFTFEIGADKNPDYSQNYYFPVYDYSRYAISQQIYLKDEIGQEECMINSVSFKVGSGSAATRQYEVYLKNTDQSTFNNSNYIAMAASDKVFDGSVDVGIAETWYTINFTTPFTYTGNNIVICVYDKTGTGHTSGYHQFYKYSATGRSLYSHGSSAYNVTSLTTGASRTYVNQIKFDAEPLTPSVKITPESLDFGTVRAGGDFWTEKETPSFNVNVKAKNTTIKTITGNDDFFKFSDVSGDVDQTEFNFTVSYNKAAEAGEKSGNIVVTYMNGEEEATVEIPMTATAYVPAQGDVIENPIEVTFDENGSYSSTPVFSGLYDDYILPSETWNEGNNPDAVYKLVLEDKCLVTANVNVGSWMAVYDENFNGVGGPKADNAIATGLSNTVLSAGTYYVLLATNGTFTFSITKSSVPAPEISYSSPTDESANNDNPALTWNMQYADEYQVLFGTSEDALEEVAAETAIEGQTEYSFQTSELQNNTKYYWQVIATNKAGTTTGEVRSFVTLLDVPQITSATAVNLYSGETTTITWEAVANATSYKVYNGEWNVLATLEATETSYELSGLEYNMTGYNITVTATQEGLGESLKSEPVVVKVAGTFPLKVNVKDSNNNPIEDATVTFNTSSALDEFQNTITAPEALKTNAEGVAEIILPLIYNDPYIFGEQIIVYANKTPFKQNFTSITPSGLSNDVLKEVNINLYLPAPSNLVPKNDEYMLLVGQDLTLNWTAVEGVTGYNVYKRGAYNNSTLTYEYEFLGTSTENTYTKVAEYDGEGSFYAVSAVFEGGLESDKISTSGRIYVFGTGDVKGLVTDTEGNPVAGAALELSGTNNFGEDIHILGTTEDDGTFLVEDVIEGTYSLTVSHYNYEAATVSGISVSNIEYELEIELTPKASIENVTVTADNNGNVRWTGDYAKWNVYRRNTNAPQKLETVATELTTTSTTDTEWETLDPGTYEYGVAALVEPQAQTRGTEVILKEDFETTEINELPEGWTKTGGNWRVTTHSIGGPVLSGEKHMWTQYSYSGEVWYLVMPALDPTGATLSFYYRTAYEGTNYDRLTICYSTSPTEGWININEEEYNADTKTLVSIPLDDIEESSIYIAFCMTSRYSSGIFIDDVLVTREKASLTETQIVWSNEVVKQGPATFIGGDTENPTAWNVDANWSTGSVPADGAEVTINANAVITSEVNVASITINNGDSYPYNTLTVADKGILTVTGTISQQSNYLLVLEEGGQIFQNNNNVTARFRMSIDNPSDWSDEAKKDGWQFISMPMADVPHTDFTSYGEYDLYKYDGSQDLEWLNHKAGIFAETEFISGKGYLASLKEAETATVYGTLNTSTYFSSYFAYNADKDLANFRLIGNPFTYDIKWGDMNPHQLADGFAIVNKDGIYEYYSGADAVIKVGQGFFIKAIAGESQYSQYIYSKQRSTRESNNSLNITATGNAGEDNVIINFAGKSEGFDKLQNFNDAIATVYVAEDGKNYGIYNCDADVQEVELCFNANQMGNYTISIEPNGKFQTVTLVDRFTGIETNMLVEDYHFTAMSNVNNNRFIVRMVNGQESTDNSHFVYQSGEELIIDAEGTVQIIDVMGRVLVSDEVESTNNRINVSGFQNGTYMVRVINGSEVKVEKVVIY